MTVLDFVRLTRANVKTIFVMFSLFLVLAFLYTSRQPVVYTATSVGYVTVDAGNSVSEQFSANTLALTKAKQYAGLVGNTRVASRVISALKLQADPSDIAGRFSAVASTDIPSLTIFASASTPAEARDLANAVIGALSKEASDLESAARPAGAPLTSLVKLVPSEQAALPSAPTSPSYPTNLLAGGVLGILLGYALSLVRRQLDSRIRTVDDMESLVGTSVLTILPESDELDRVGAAGIVQSQTGPAAEALRQLRTNLRFVDVDNPPQSIVVTSANAGEGKSVVTSNLARVLAAAGQKTMLIDGDLRRPMVSSIFDLDPAIGLTQVLAGDLTLEHTIQDPGLPNLRVIVAGRIPPNPSELLGSQRMQHMIEDLVSQGYLVLIDAPPLLPVTDAGLLSGTVDGAILVLAVGRTFKEQAKLAGKVLDQVGGHLLGSVLNRAPQKGIGSVVYGYGYGTHSQDYYSAYVYGSSRTPSSWRARRKEAKRVAEQAQRDRRPVERLERPIERASQLPAVPPVERPAVSDEGETQTTTPSGKRRSD
ncbi:MAG: receptor protein-tyrosine kinase [Nocardioidaceae bacterium]|nr:receptor protein-tyrosine kinase [Nocardioidaceae bacterium]